MDAITMTINALRTFMRRQEQGGYVLCQSLNQDSSLCGRRAMYVVAGMGWSGAHCRSHAFCTMRTMDHQDRFMLLIRYAQRGARAGMGTAGFDTWMKGLR